ncbi:hypothetical protein M5K25_007759 [Dendrobium thyrsiflorum]|uniref:Uncharacterized protein n=1 Tax=Dendrobium thyrsiflorum TaxID=117978 RepID=A0ABD0VMC8_DENTH
MASASKLLKQTSLDAFLHPNPSKTLNPIYNHQSLASSNSTSDYERIRLETIRRNSDFLQKLGLASTPPAPKPQTRKRIPKTPSLPSIPLRRSTRKRGPPPPPSDDTDEPSLPFDVEVVDSSVFRYACDGENHSSFVPLPSVSTFSASIVGFKFVGSAFRDPSLTNIYTLDACFLEQERFLVAAGGHAGFISVYGGEGTAVEEDGTQRPLMSWKGSRSWVSGVMFMERNPMLLVSSSNDGKIIVWDIKKQQYSSTWIPPIVTESVGLHSSGIFSMDRFDCLIATASKDSSVGISRLLSGGELVAERNISGHHSGAIRGVCFGDDKDKLADCGADGRICILDARLKKPCTIIINSQHSTSLNSVEWCRMNNVLLLTASRDPTLLLYDIRSYADPLCKLAGHVETNSGICQQIYKPSFIDGGTQVATVGQGTGKISLYSVEKAKLLSQGMIGYDANLVKPFEYGTADYIIWTAGRQINQFRPLRNHLQIRMLENLKGSGKENELVD